MCAFRLSILYRIDAWRSDNTSNLTDHDVKRWAQTHDIVVEDVIDSDGIEVWVRFDGSELCTFGASRLEYDRGSIPYLNGCLTVIPAASCVRAGWPLLALVGERLYSLDRPRPASGIIVEKSGWLDLSGGTSTYDMLPFKPIWPGFLVNTLLYATVWFTLIFGWRAHMRMIRRWQGHCPMCKYDLRGGLATDCPECGWNRAVG